MAGIAGIAKSGETARVQSMLDAMKHRGGGGHAIVEADGGTIGVIWTKSIQDKPSDIQTQRRIQDGLGHGRLAQAGIIEGILHLSRDELGAAPLYFGRSKDGEICFASEVKALLVATPDVQEFPAGHRLNGDALQQYFRVHTFQPSDTPPDAIAEELRTLLDTAVSRVAGIETMGCWLSGGLDSSTMVALARRHFTNLHTFSAGVKGAPDLEYAREVGKFLGSNHHEVIVSLDDMVKFLPQVVFHLESFDALLVRSSVTNYLVAKLASDYVSDIFSGEAGDELFAGYEYLKSIPIDRLPEELVDIIGRLHNTAFQRVDRCASAHGIMAFVPFADPEVVNFALQIPCSYKLHNGIEKWILRNAVEGLLPERVVKRPKAKFWEGAGVGEMLAEYANQRISDADFNRERQLPNGWTLNSKEEQMYYRIFSEWYTGNPDLSWMGRTKGVPTR